MPDKIDPKTGLPSLLEVADRLDNANQGKAKSTAYSFDPAIFTAPVNIDETIEGGDSMFKTLMKPEELVMGNFQHIEQVFGNRYDEAVKERTKQLHDDQGYITRLAKGAVKFGGKTLTNVVGGIAGTVYGLGKAFMEGDASKFYQDNEVFNALDVVDEFIDDNTVIYGESGYYGKGFMDKLSTDPTKLFLDEGSSAASFVAGAVLTEIASSGIASLGILGRLGNAASKGLKFAKGLDAGLDATRVGGQIMKNSKAINYLDDIKNLGGTSRALLMGSGYEASLEARENYDSVLNSLIEDHRGVYGSDPMDADLAKYEEAAKSSSLWTFGGNLALVGGSNLMQFPKLFWKGYNGQKSLWKNLTGQKAPSKFTTDAAGNVVSRAAAAGIEEKVLKYGYRALKNPIREGMEELSQGALNHTTMEYYSRKYSPDDNKEALNVMESFSKSINNMMAGPEASNAFGMGFLMGLVGLPGMKQKKSGKIGIGAGSIGGTYSELSQYNKELKDLKAQAAAINAQGGLNQSLKSTYENFVNNMSIQKEMDDAVQSGDIHRFKNLEHDQFYSYIRGRQKANMLDVVKADLENLRDNISTEAFNADLGMKDVAEFNDQTKKEALDKAIEFVDRVEKNADIVERALENKGVTNANPNLVEQLIHSASVLDNVDVREQELSNKVSELTNGSINPIGIYKRSLEKESELGFKQMGKVALAQFEIDNPIKHAKHKEEIQAALEDVAKLQERKEAFIKNYNYLFSTEGQEQFNELEAEMQKEFTKQYEAKVNEEAEQAETQKQEERAKEQAEGTSEKAETTVDTTINNKKKEASREAGTVDIADLPTSLRERYATNPDIFEDEISELNIQLAEDQKNPLPTTFDKFIRAIDSYSLADSGVYYTHIQPFFKEITDAIDNKEQATYKKKGEDQSDTKDDESGQQTGESAGSAPISKPNVQSRQYAIVDGSPDRSQKGENYANMTEEDFAFVNDPSTLKEGEEVELEIDLGDKFSDNVEDIKIKVVKNTPEGKYTIGLLSSSTVNPAMADIRDSVMKGLESSGMTVGTYSHPQGVKVKYMGKGMILNTTAKTASFKKIQDPNKLNVKYRSENSHDEILLGYGNRVNGVTQIEVPNFKGKVPHYDKLTPGVIYMFIKGADGVAIPVRLKTRTINKKETQELANHIQTILDGNLSTEEYAEVNAKIYAITPIEIKRKTAEDFVIKRTKIINGEVKDTVSPMIKLGRFIELEVPNLLKQIDKDSINKKGFNEASLGADLRTNLNMQTPIVNANLEIDPESLADKEFKEYEAPKATEAPKVAKRAPKAKIVPVSTSVKGKKLKKPNKRFRKDTSDSALWDSEKELGWLSKNLPNVPANVLDDLYQIHKNGAVEAWGVFQNASIYLDSNAGAGTAYHEAFHAVFNLMLNDTERAALLEQAKERYGLTDVIDLEESMADEFMNYILAEEGKKYKKSWLGRLFDRIMRLMNLSSTKGLTINSLFEDISGGRFAGIEGSPIKRNIKKFEDITRYKIPGLNPVEKRERLDMIIHDAISKIEEGEVKGRSKIKAFVRDTYQATLNDMLDSPEDFEGWSEEDLGYGIQQLNTVVANFDIMWEEVLTKLPSYGYNTVKPRKEQLVEELTEQEDSEETTVKEGWQESNFEKSTKDTVTNKVKKALARIENKDRDGDVIPDSLGNDTYVPYDKVFNSLKHELSGIYNYSDMKAKMQDMVSSKPFMQDIIDMVDADSKLRSGFFSAMATQTAEFSLLLANNRTEKVGDKTAHYTEYNIINPNRKNPENSVSDNWKSAFELRFNADTMEEAKPYIANARTAFNDLMQAKSSRILDANTLGVAVDNLNNLGLNFTEDNIRRIVSNDNGLTDFSELKNLYASLNVLFNTIEKGQNPFEFGTHREGKSITNLAKKYVEVNLEIYEKSFKNVENKVIFSNILPNHVAKLFHKLNKDNATIDWYQKDPFYQNNVWLNELKEDSAKDLFSFTYVDGIKSSLKDKGTKYDGMSKADITNLKMQMYSNNGSSDVAYYAMPILADAPQQMFIKFKKYSNEDALNALYDVARQDVNRAEWLTNNPSKIKNFNSELVYMPFLRGVDINNKAAVIEAIKSNLLQPEINLTIEQMKKFDMVEEIEDGIRFTSKSKPNSSSFKGVNEFVASYVYNTTLSNFMSSQIFSGDLAYYKGVEDFAKRNKQIANPGRILDTTEIGDTFKTLYVADEELPSKFLEQYEEALKDHPNKNAILAQYTEVNATDAQAYISLDRYKDVLTGMGMWTDAHEDAYPALKSGIGNTEQLGLFLQPLKPFYFGKIEVDGKIVPIQNKNSEYVVLPQVAKGNPKMEKMLSLFDRGVDSIQFETAVKVGAHNVNDFSSIRATVGFVIENAVQLNNEDYGIQLEVPEHHQDAQNLFGTQIRKLITSDLEKGEYEYAIGEGLSAADLFDKYQDIISTDIDTAYDSLSKMFGSDANIQKLLMEEVISRDLGSKYVEALELDENGKFKYPLFSPMHSKRNESLLSALFTNRVIKQKVRGASMVQVSDFALSKRLKVKMKEDGGLDHLEAILPHYAKKYFEPFMDANGDIDIKAVEAQAPELLEAVSYRIPTEDKYSMLPIKIVGFSPSIAGGSIILPADVTAITGADFDIDKMFLMFNSFDMSSGKPEYIAYDWGKEASEQSQAARDNAKVELIRGVIRDPKTFDKWITPGGFEAIRKERDRIKRSKGKSPALNIGLQSSYLELFNRNMSGKNLIGIFANHNANHAIMQWTNVEFSSPVKFNGESYTSIHGTGENGRISRSLAELLAAMVDNAKDPLAGELNINTFTADVLATIIRTGYPLDVALNFINQPVITELAEAYYNAGGSTYVKDKLYGKYRDSLLNTADISKEESQDRGGYNLNNSPLKNNLSTKFDKLNKEQAEHQLVVLDVFMRLHGKGENLNKLIKAFRADSIGAGPTMSKNSLFIDNKKDIITSSAFLEGTVGLAFDQYESMGKFADVINNTNKHLAEHFPWEQPTYIQVKDEIKKIKGTDLREDEMEFINYSLLSYLTSSFDFFNLDKNGFNRLINKFPATYAKRVENNAILNEGLLLTRLIGLDKNSKGKEVLTFNTNAKLSSVQMDQLQEDFEYLLSKEEFKGLAEDLIKYSFAVSGLRFAPNSFNNLIPVSIMDSIKSSEGISLGEHMKNNSEALDEVGIVDFMDKFIRNNYYKFDYLTEAVVKGPNQNVDGVKKSKNGIPLSFRLSSDSVTNLVTFEGSGITNAMPYIKYDVNDKTYLYKLTTPSDSKELIYEIVVPMGIPNQASELTVNMTEGAFAEENAIKIVTPKGTINYNSNDLNRLKEVMENSGLDVSDYFFDNEYDYTENLDKSEEEVIFVEEIEDNTSSDIYSETTGMVTGAPEIGQIMAKDSTNEIVIFDSNYVPVVVGTFDPVKGGFTFAEGFDTSSISDAQFKLIKNIC